MSKHSVIALILLGVLTGCTISQDVQSVSNPVNGDLCIIESPNVRESFLLELRSVLGSKQLQNRLVPAGSVTSVCEWVLTYTARWSWDLALYLSYVEIQVFHLGVLDGEARYDATRGGANLSKFIDAEPKIRELVDELFL